MEKWCAPVDWLHLPGDAQDGPGGKVVKLLEEVPDVGPVLQVQVHLHDPRQTWKKVLRYDTSILVPNHSL